MTINKIKKKKKKNNSEIPYWIEFYMQLGKNMYIFCQPFCWLLLVTYSMYCTL